MEPSLSVDPASKVETLKLHERDMSGDTGIKVPPEQSVRFADFAKFIHLRGHFPLHRNASLKEAESFEFIVLKETVVRPKPPTAAIVSDRQRSTARRISPTSTP